MLTEASRINSKLKQIGTLACQGERQHPNHHPLATEFLTLVVSILEGLLDRESRFSKGRVL